MPSRISQIRNGMQPIPQTQQSAQPQINTDYLNQIKAIMHSGNSQQLLINMIAQNPQARQALQMVRSGGDLKTIAENMAQQRGIDLNALVKELMQDG